MGLIQPATFWRHDGSSGAGGLKLDANFEQLDGLFGPLHIRHVDGTATGYMPAADTDLARGVALRTAVEAMVERDTLYLTGGVYEINDSGSPILPGGIASPVDNVAILGAGRDATHIKRTESGEILYITDGSAYSGFTVESTPGVASSEPMLVAPGCTNAWLHNLRLLNTYSRQALWLASADRGLTLIDCELQTAGVQSYGSVTAYNCLLGNSWLGPDGILEAYNCRWRDNRAGVPLLDIEGGSGDTCVATLYDCDFYSTDSGDDAAIFIEAGTLTMYGGQVRRPNGGKAVHVDPRVLGAPTATLYRVFLDGGSKDVQVDAGGDGGTANLHNCMFDPVKVQNNQTLNYLGGKGPQRTLEANLASVPDHADNAAAKASGMVDGQLYRTGTGDLMVVYT